MTEITGNCKFRDVDLFAFSIALFGAPLVVAALGLWIYLIPVFALYFGYVPYLVFGGPILFIYFWLFPQIHSVPTILLFLVNFIVFSEQLQIADTVLGLTRDMSASYGRCGLIFAPAWGAMFEVLYALARQNPEPPLQKKRMSQ